MNKIVVYHVCCMNDWKNIFDNQINKLIRSGLLKEAKLYLTALYNTDEDLNYIKDKIKDLGELTNTSKSFDLFEFPALGFIKKKAKTEDFYVLYLHTKGVSITEKNMNYYHGSRDLKHLKECVTDWKDYMEYFLVDNYQECIKALEECDACGVNLRAEPVNHFSGNFWWSKSSYINKLPEMRNINLSNRYSAEFWIGSGNGNLKNFYTNDDAGYLKRLDNSYKIYDKI